ncbi:type I-E CRISPR-associated protein Cse2/CasB [Leptospirillum ferriphilum]|jgi:CRISPR system Cascade subunit CasB|uniref:CRISPR-associated protein, Cse2 family n=1 Tax=Leptospirillum ferriphilum TaxID=178606 RepID=A0A2I2MFM6_9BACT|nr:type I-E CRISPR-associated protein Cse2/CasB [Leptospirillum ferriphilum]
MIENQNPSVPQKPSYERNLAFVDYIVRRCEANNGIRAGLKRADNPNTEYQGWDVLAGFGIDLTNESERLSHAIIGADIARTKASGNGPFGIGRAIARCYTEGNKDDQAKSRLRRLLACDSLREAILVLRQVFRLIESRGAGTLNYASLLGELRWFNHEDSRNRTKVRWAQEFYGRSNEWEDQ